MPRSGRESASAATRSAKRCYRASKWPESFATLAGDDLRTALDATQSQQAQFNAGLGALRAEQAINARKAEGFSQQIAGSQGQLELVTRQQALLDQQLQGVRSLAAKGYASQNTVRNLESTAAELSGSRSQHAADIADFHQQQAEAFLEFSSLERQRSQTAASALRETEDEGANAISLTPSARRKARALKA